MISVSNIAWEVAVDDRVAELLQKHQMQYIDIAPPKYFRELSKVSEAEIVRVREYWIQKGITPLGMQSLLFGTQGLNLFGSEESRRAMLEHLSHVCRIGKHLGATKLVFGSPKNRDRAGLNDEATSKLAVSFFRQLGDIARNSGVTICLEPNPVCYHANFMVDSRETAAVVKAVNHPNIRMQLDTGAMCINQEDAEEVIADVAPFVHHIHISEPQLAPLDINNEYHYSVASAIKKHLPGMPLTIEMLTSVPDKALYEIEQSVHLIKDVYLKESAV